MVALMHTTLSARRRIIAVLCGGFCGTLTRYLLSSAIQGWLGKGWPYDILFINLSGAFVLTFVTNLADDTFLVGPTRRLFINVGFLGAYTTFSSLALGIDLHLHGNQYLSALLYLLISMGGGLLVVPLGERSGKWFIRVARKHAVAPEVTGKFTQTGTIPPSNELSGNNHLDIQDDLLLPDRTDKPV